MDKSTEKEGSFKYPWIKYEAVTYVSSSSGNNGSISCRPTVLNGCGNSRLSEELYADGFVHITNIDYSTVVIEKMKKKCASLSEMKWLEMDATNLKFADHSFDVVLEKGTLDAMMVQEKDPWQVSAETQTLIDRVLTEVSRVLTEDGSFISITFAQPHFRSELYSKTDYKWSVKNEPFGDSFHYFMYSMKKGETLEINKCRRTANVLNENLTIDQSDREDYLFDIANNDEQQS